MEEGGFLEEALEIPQKIDEAGKQAEAEAAELESGLGRGTWGPVGQETTQSGGGPMEGELPANSGKRTECLNVFSHLKILCFSG